MYMSIILPKYTLLPSAAFVTASSGTLSSVNFATDRRIGRPCAIEKDVQADVAAGSVAIINAVKFIFCSCYELFQNNNVTLM